MYLIDNFRKEEPHSILSSTYSKILPQVTHHIFIIFAFFTNFTRKTIIPLESLLNAAFNYPARNFHGQEKELASKEDVLKNKYLTHWHICRDISGNIAHCENLLNENKKYILYQNQLGEVIFCRDIWWFPKVSPQPAAMRLIPLRLEDHIKWVGLSKQTLLHTPLN